MSELRLSRGDVVVCVAAGDYGKPRPSVVVQSDLFNDTHESVVVCPISSHLSGLSLFRVEVRASAVNGLRRTSEVMVDKIVSLKRARVHQHVGRLTQAELQAVDEVLRKFLELQTDLATLPS